MAIIRGTIKAAIVAVCIVAVSRPSSGAELEQLQETMMSAAARMTADDGTVKINTTAVTARIIKDYVTPAICSFAPGSCVHNQIQSRGIQSYLATAGTMFAGVLGIILTKIKILLVLSVLTTVFVKMMLLFFFFKPEYHHGSYYHHYKGSHHHTPFVKYTKDKYYIKNSPSEHNHDVIVESDHSPYHGHKPGSGVNYYKRR